MFNTTTGSVLFSRDPIVTLGGIVLPAGTFPAPELFKLPARPHQEILQLKKQKCVGILEYLASGEVHSSMRVLTWLLKLEERQTQATLSGMSAEKLVLPEDLGLAGRIYGIIQYGGDFIYPTKVFRFFSSGKTSSLNLNHHWLCQLVRIQLQHFYEIKYWIPEKVLLKERKFPNIPDGVFDFDGLRFCIEVELSPKLLSAQESILKTYCDMLCEVPDPGAWANRVIFFTPFVDLMVERINEYARDEFKHLFFVQFLDPVVLSYKRGSYLLNDDLLKFLGSKD